MSRAEVYAGICGHSAVIEVTKVDERSVQVVIHSACEQITAMNPDLARIQWKGRGHEVFKRMMESVVYQSADKHIRHTACPIPMAILKAIEIEAGIALPQDVTITFSADRAESLILPDSASAEGASCSPNLSSIEIVSDIPQQGA
jgi:hypothetical protein